MGAMLDGKRILVVVPARGGSKGIPLKNLAKVCGETLIAHTAKIIHPHLDGISDCNIVSTDHPDIATEAIRHGLGVPFIRPHLLSLYMVSDHAVLYHALTEMERIDGHPYDVVIMLQPTCPMRRVWHVEHTVGRIVYAGNDSAWTVTRVDRKYHPLKHLQLGPEGALDYYTPEGRNIIARQQLEPTFIRNGAAYAFTRECLLVQQTIMGKKSAAVVIDEPLVNIDTPEDLAECERRMCAAG
jgi:CMP-N-acetylneuraminic acid synthetase